MKQTRTIWLILVPLAVTCAGLMVLTGMANGSSTHHRINLMTLIPFCAGLIMFLAMAVAFFNKHRGVRVVCRTVFYSMFLGSFCSFGHIMKTQANVRAELDSAYRQLANSGPPFPESAYVRDTHLSDIHPNYKVGYWTSEDRETFVIFYHQSSSSKTITYPNGEWVGQNGLYQSGIPLSPNEQR